MNNIRKTRTCSYCHKEFKNIEPLELGHHVKTCLIAIEEKKKMKKIVFPDITSFNFTHKHPLTPLKAIRQKCMDCSTGQQSELLSCPIVNCPLWTRRFGVTPQAAHKQGKKVTEDWNDE